MRRDGRQCKVGDAVVAQEAMIPLAVPVQPAEKFTRSPTYVTFRIEGLQPVDAPLAFPPLLRTAEATLRVHFLVWPEIVDLIKVGDVALGDPATGIDLGRGVLARSTRRENRRPASPASAPFSSSRR